jgi:probable rRNA maturation factor
VLTFIATNTRPPGSLPPARIKKIAAHLTQEFKLDRQDYEAGITFLTRPAMQKINHDFRGLKKPTNVLSFPEYGPEDVRKVLRQKKGAETIYLGDILLCFPYIRQEAVKMNKPLNHHLTHLIVHGLLHLLGYDHEDDHDAQRMEKLEISLLHGLAIPDPYDLR